ncbi:hypothetical protein PENTCL1PPCAC_11149, partial [Pristionchus entomophagus]
MMRRIDWSSEGFSSHGSIPAIDFGVSESFSTIHSECSSSYSESDSLGSPSTDVTLTTVEFRRVLSTREGVQQLVAHRSFEAHLMPFVSAGVHLLCRIDGLAALGTLGVFNGLERHLGMDWN